MLIWTPRQHRDPQSRRHLCRLCRPMAGVGRQRGTEASLGAPTKHVLEGRLHVADGRTRRSAVLGSIIRAGRSLHVLHGDYCFNMPKTRRDRFFVISIVNSTNQHFRYNVDNHLEFW